MGASRKGMTENKLMVLYNQVDSLCPNCSRPLVTQKTTNYLKQFEVAHIYPLNPTDAEKKLLEFEERMNPDVDHLDNLIPLCESCHGIFDKERTVEEYQDLVAKKKAAIQRDRERSMWHQFNVRSEIEAVVLAIITSPDTEIDSTSLEYTPKEVQEKTKCGVSGPTRRNIHSDVRYYFPFIKTQLRRLEEQTPSAADIIAQQVKVFSMSAAMESSGEDLYFKVARWLEHRTDSSPEVARILTSFFVQNCEVMT